jgi:hypothetical protein
VLIGSEYPPASHGVRFLVGVVFAPSPFFCCSAAFAFNNEVTSILRTGQVVILPPDNIPCVTFSHIGLLSNLAKCSRGLDAGQGDDMQLGRLNPWDISLSKSPSKVVRSRERDVEDMYA